MRQYIDIKKQHPDCLLFYRMGDFFEMFFEDAVTASRELDIALTKRGKYENKDIPMCGVPVQSFEGYLSRLIQGGYKVAICDQTETPEAAKKRGNKGPLQRSVIRIVTMGTLTEDELLSPNHNYIMAVSLNQANKATMSVAVADVSTGFLGVESFCKAEIGNVLARWSPVEVIMSDETFSAFLPVFEPIKKRLTLLPKARFNSANARALLETVYNVCSLDIFGKMQEQEVQAAGILVDYIMITQCTRNISLLAPKIICSDEFMGIDASTRRNLELATSQSENGLSLFATLNKTVTSVGRRLLQNWLMAPLTDITKINERLDLAGFFMESPSFCEEVRGALGGVPDIERILSRIVLGRVAPKDLLSLKIALRKVDSVWRILRDKFFPSDLQAGFGGETEVGSASTSEQNDSTASLASSWHILGRLSELKDLLEQAIKDEVPILAKDGNFIKDSFDEKLKYHRGLHTNASEMLIDLQHKYIQQTGINNLRVGSNNVWGVYIEVSSGQISKVPFDFIHRQTLTNYTRYTTPELIELEKSLKEAEHLALLRELDLFGDLCAAVLDNKDKLLKLSQAIAEIDVFASIAFLAEKYNYVRPSLTTDNVIEIEEGRHPVVELSFKDDYKNFTSNNCIINESRRFLLITGPNMSGKSTYLRQNALIIIMAQAGFFVPAKGARIGIVDKIFSRIGASDDIASGRSTFMVEMMETSAILHQASARSFVILDEIGRGTSTYDGLAIAWAVSEYVYGVIACRTMFATHYHEITELNKNLPGLVPLTAAIQEWEGKVIFLHKIVDGVAKRSYGINVAQLAGLPKSVILRAVELLESFEGRAKDGPKAAKLTKEPAKGDRDEEHQKLF
jgi:DNA mismatch repair protein MutS